jgi:hypothetical protein
VACACFEHRKGCLLYLPIRVASGSAHDTTGWQ